MELEAAAVSQESASRESAPDTRAQALRKYFGYAAFRPLQREIIETILAGKDAFVLMPTGGGKSLCFQLPALLLPGLTVVVSPLISLMKDQVDALQSAGIKAAFINSSLMPEDVDATKRSIAKGEIKLLYVAPERLLMPGFLRFLSNNKVSLFAIDEAHCISEWGHDFREEYRQLSRLKVEFPNLPIIAMTATATERVQSDILTQLGFGSRAAQYRASFDRPNLTYNVRPRSGKVNELIDYIGQHKGEAGIIYFGSRNRADQFATALEKSGFRALPYHAGLDVRARERHQEKFDRDEVDIICATIAFGMGIDKPNVRYVIHYDLPKNLASYYQETGRAGRDGLPSDCTLFFSLGDKVRQLRMIEEKPSLHERHQAMSELEHVVTFAELTSCRRALLLAYFDERYTKGNCGACDNCLTPPTIEMIDGTTIAQKFLSCVVRVRESFGANHIIDILRGSESDKIFRFRHQDLTTYGIGKDYSKDEWSSFARQLVREGLLRQDFDNHNVLKLTKQGAEVLTSRRSIQLRKPTAKVSAAKSAKQSSFLEKSAERNDELFQQLRTLRREIATRQNVPPYVIFNDYSLVEMSKTLPLSPEEFLSVQGVGEVKLKRYGKAFLDLIKAFVEEHPEARRA